MQEEKPSEIIEDKIEDQAIEEYKVYLRRNDVTL